MRAREADKELNAEYMRAYRAVRNTNSSRKKELPPHGTRKRFIHRSAPCKNGCPNVEFTCRDANNQYMNEYRQGVRLKGSA